MKFLKEMMEGFVRFFMMYGLVTGLLDLVAFNAALKMNDTEILEILHLQQSISVKQLKEGLSIYFSLNYLFLISCFSIAFGLAYYGLETYKKVIGNTVGCVAGCISVLAFTIQNCLIFALICFFMKMLLDLCTEMIQRKKLKHDKNSLADYQGEENMDERE